MALAFTPEELTAIRAEYCKGATDTQFDLFISECKARSLRPGVHLVFQLRRAKEFDSTVGAYVYVQKPYWITTIAALRLIAQRTGDYLGQGTEEYIYLDKEGNPTIKSEIPLPHEDPAQRPLPREPWVARATVYRKGFNQPMIGMARFEAYATIVVPKDGTPYLSETWRKRGCEQLFKCAEALALRRAYPEEMAGLLLSEELKEEIEEAQQIAVTPAVAVSLPPPVPAVNQTPAVGTDAPRPNEEQKALVREALPKLEKFLENPEVQKQLSEEGKKVDFEAIEKLKKEVGLKPASELPPPEKKKRGPKPKPSPNNGQIPGEITDADIPTAENPLPPAPTEAEKEANKQEAGEFVESIDPTPTPEEQKGFTARVRTLAASGALNADLKNYILNVGKKSDPKQLTVGNWKQALGELESLDKDKLKEVTKNAPLPAF